MGGTVKKWTTTENTYLMQSAYKVSWSEIAEVTGRTEDACKAHYKKIQKLRKAMGTWKGLK